jgi:hypothetical protein
MRAILQAARAGGKQPQTTDQGHDAGFDIDQTTFSAMNLNAGQLGDQRV